MKKITLLDRRRAAPASQELAPRFWDTKSLPEMNSAEWAALCDNCGKCCVISIEDVDSGELYLTDVSCKLFDSKKGQCGDYASRKKLVPDCVKLSPKFVPMLDWLPQTCA
jgi:uncharacterized cysteine cluster protein YcgN (CxxCxxCC family)